MHKFIIYVMLSLPVNYWVYENMHRYYYWADQMPAHPDYSLPTAVFFKTLLSPKDRFSYISNRNEPRQAHSSVECFGFHYRVIDSAAVVTLVVPGSVAGNKGMKRGMMITGVNGKPVSAATIDQALCDRSVVLKLKDSASLALRSAPVPVQSVYGMRVFEKKVGYLAYFSCAEGQDAYVAQQVGQLREAGIKELILDLRYNSGGAVASVAKLGAMLTPVFNPAQTFITYNSNRGKQKLSFEQAALQNIDCLEASHLRLSRIFILTTATTSSAAELLINNLSPFMQVIRIGETTRGKDEAAFAIEDPAVSWTIMPTVYKIANARGKGNYATGIQPHFFVKDNASAPLGLRGDPLVDQAISLIKRELSSGRRFAYE